MYSLEAALAQRQTVCRWQPIRRHGASWAKTGGQPTGTKPAAVTHRNLNLDNDDPDELEPTQETHLRTYYIHYTHYIAAKLKQFTVCRLILSIIGYFFFSASELQVRPQHLILAIAQKCQQCKKSCF